MTFVLGADVRHDSQPWGATDWLVNPQAVGSRQLVVAQIIIESGKGHSFHLHPTQEEVLVILEGHLEQWVENVCQELGPGEAVHIPPNVVHASFNHTSSPVRALVALGPCVGDADGYEQVDKSEEEPWKSLLPIR